MPENEVSIYWKGVWKISSSKVPYEITDQGGIYMILTGKRDTIFRTWKIMDQVVYIGFAENLRKGLRDCDKWSIWEEHNQHDLLVKVAVTDAGVSKEAIQYCLVQKTRPLCNTFNENEDAIQSTDILTLLNKGKKWPLGDSYRHSIPQLKSSKEEDSKKEKERERLRKAGREQEPS
jgi:hypothetical protein